MSLSIGSFTRYFKSSSNIFVLNNAVAFSSVPSKTYWYLPSSPLNFWILQSTGSTQSFWYTTATPFGSFAISSSCSSLSPADFPAMRLSCSSGSRIIIFVFVFRIAEISTALGDWSTIINPSPYVLISAIAFEIISTDFPATFAPSEFCSVDTFFKILCASSKIVTCLSGWFIS